MLFKKFLSVILVFLLFSFCGCEKKKKFEAILYNLGSDPSTLDPQVANDYSSNVLIINLFEGLIRLDKDGHPGKGMAESWESFDNNKTFIFHLKKDAKWSDSKTNVTAKDFLYGIKRAVDPNTSSKSAKLIYVIKNARNINIGEKEMKDLGVEVLDDFTLKINLEYSFEDFPKMCMLSPMMPCNEEFFKNSSGQYGKNSKTVMGNGPFKFGSSGWEHGKTISIIKNEDYAWKEERAFTPSINFTIKESSKDKNFAVDLFKQEETDLAYVSDLGILEDIKKSGAKFSSFKDTSWGVILNCSSDVFSNEKVRQGFFGSIDRDYLMSKLPRNKFTPNGNIILDNMSIGGKNYKQHVREDVYFNKLDNAKDLFYQGISENNIESLRDVEIYCADDEEVKIIGDTLLELFNKNLEHNFNIKYMPRNELAKKVDSADFRVALVQILCKNDNPLDLLNCFKSNSEENIAIFKDQTYDNLIKDAGNSEASEIIEKIKTAEKYLSDKAVFYPICTDFSNFVYSKKIDGVIFYPYQIGIDFSFAKKIK